MAIIKNPLTIVQGGGGDGAALNIAYGDTAPSDTSKIWVKADEPTSYTIDCYTSDVDPLSSVVAASATLPTARYATSCATVGTDIYIFGGNESGVYLDQILKYDALTDTCTTMTTTLPTAREGTSCAAVGTDIYIFGGFGNGYLNTILKYDTLTDTCTTMTATLPTNCSRTSCATVGTDVYIFGGTNANYINQILRYDTLTDTCTTMTATLPAAYSEFSCSAVGTDIYIFGGRNNNGRINRILKYNTFTDTCTTMTATLPTNCSGTSCSSVGTDIYIFGGYAYAPAKTVLRYDTLTDTCTTMTSTLPTGCHMSSCAIVGAGIYIFGGSYSNSSTSKLSSILKFSPNMPLQQEKAIIIAYNSIRQLKGYLFNTEQLKLGVFSLDVFIGDENGIGQKKQAYYHNGTDWVEF